MKKDVYAFPAIFYYDSDGISIEFPDLPGCLPCARTPEEAFKNAREALGLHLYAMEQDGDDLPEPTSVADLRPEAGGAVVLIDADLAAVRASQAARSANQTLPRPARQAAASMRDVPPRQVKLLYVDACPRAEASRTRRLAKTFLDALNIPGLRVTEHRLYEMNLLPVDGGTLARRETLCDRGDWDDPMCGPAREAREADAVVIAAPYWDFSFPSALKVWVEQIYVRNLTFRYEADRCVGLCRAKEAVYLSTAGGMIGENDWGGGYMKAALGMIGVPGFTAVYAEGLDLAGADAEAILRQAEAEARRAARELSERFSCTAP